MHLHFFYVPRIHLQFVSCNLDAISHLKGIVYRLVWSFFFFFDIIRSLNIFVYFPKGIYLHFHCILYKSKSY